VPSPFGKVFTPGSWPAPGSFPRNTSGDCSRMRPACSFWEPEPARKRGYCTLRILNKWRAGLAGAGRRANMNTNLSSVRYRRAVRVPAGWRVACHEQDGRPHNPSLSIREVDGKILGACHAGCSQQDVDRGSEGARALGSTSTSTDMGNATYTPGPVVAEYSYTDEHGELLYQVTRTFRRRLPPASPDGRGDGSGRKHPHQVLYPSTRNPRAAIIFVTEGRADAETLRSHGFVATTNAAVPRRPGCQRSPWRWPAGK